MSSTTDALSSNSDLCSICLSSLTEPGKDIYTTTCQHRFHFTCLVKSVQAQNNECPLCRTHLESLVNIIQKVGGRRRVRFQTIQRFPSEALSSQLRTPTQNESNLNFQNTSSEDPIDEEVVRVHSRRIQDVRQRITNSTAAPSYIVATTTLEFGGQPSNQASNIYGMVTIDAPSLLISASEAEINELRIPVDMICIVDQSASMNGRKITLLKNTLDYIVDQMNCSDRLAIISFDRNAYNRSNGLIRMIPENKQAFHNTIIQSINVNRGTCIGSGLKMGIRMLNSRRTKNPIGAILLLTDGEDNNNHDYTDLMQTLPQDVVCHTFGYGLGHNAALLSRLAEQGNGGTFTFIDQVVSIDLAFATVLGSLFTCVAQNLTIKLEFDGQYAVTHSHNIYKHEPVQLPSRQVTFKLHDLNADEKRNLVFQLNVPKLSQPSNGKNIIGRVSLEYTDVASNRQIQTPEVTFFLQRPFEIPQDSRLLRVNYALDVQRNRAETSRVLKEAVEQSDYERARQLLETQLAKIRASVSAKDRLCLQLIQDLQHRHANRHEFASNMTNMYMQHGQERSTYSTDTISSSISYVTPGQKRFLSQVRK